MATGALRDYACRARFPRNDRFRDRLVPFFIDDAGTRCAVAHLVESTGDHAIARRVRRTRNNARVAELASEPALVRWARQNGLSLAELARIQPSYCFVSHADACFCTGNEAAEAAEVKVEVASSNMGTVTAIYGSGPVAVGAKVQVYGNLKDGDTALVGIDAMGSVSMAGKLTADGSNVDTAACGTDAPTLQKADAVAAILATKQAGANDGQSACSAHLDGVNDYWGASQCEDGGGDGASACAMASGDAPLVGPFGFTALALGLALWMRRRRARRAKWAARPSASATRAVDAAE